MLNGAAVEPDDSELLTLFEALALKAGQLINDIRAAGFSVERKKDSTPVTEADLRAEIVIRDGLASAYPDLPMVGEEAVEAGEIPEVLGDRFVLVDPLDGTREFVAGREEFTVNIALVREGRPAVGVVLAPAMGVMFAGRPGLAERINVAPDGSPGKRTAIHVRPAHEPVHIVASRSHRTRETDAFIERYPGAEIVSVGSSLKFCQLASGEADLYPRFGRTMEWDTAAGDAVLRAAGGTTVRVDPPTWQQGEAGLLPETGEYAPLTYGKRDQPHDSDFANPWFIAKGGA